MKLLKSIMIIIICVVGLKAENSKMRIAILDFQPKNVSKETADMVTDLIRIEMLNTGVFKIIERGEMDAILKEQEFQLSGCVETECAVEAGRLLSANKILVGNIGKLGTAYIISARIVDVEEAEMQFGEKASSYTEEGLQVAANNLADKLTAKINGINLIKKYNCVQNKELSHDEKKQELKRNPNRNILIYGGLGLLTLSIIIASAQADQSGDTAMAWGVGGTTVGIAMIFIGVGMSK